MYWYHPHVMSAAQVGFGLSGALLVIIALLATAAVHHHLIRAGKRVFLDMKLLDIENTVERATRNAATAGSTWSTTRPT